MQTTTLPHTPLNVRIKMMVGLLLVLLALTAITGIATHAAGTDAVSLHFYANAYPAGQCTWYADGRYAALHGVMVPWTPYYNAKDWTQEAYAYGWHVSSLPTVGDIMVLQPYVQWAGPLGHVAIVEQKLPNGDVFASNRNWGLMWWQQQETRLIKFSPGPGVAFLHQ